MSIDTEVLGTTLLGLGDLSLGEGWEDFDGEISFEGGGWQVLVAEPEETAEGGYLYGITLEPVGAPDEALQRLVEVVMAIARQTQGVTSDPRSGEKIDFRS